MTLSPKERLVRAARNLEVDEIPTIGGWINGVTNLASIAGLSIEQYLQAPMQGVIRAHQVLRVDGMIAPAVPTDVHAIRTGLVEDSAFADKDPEDLVALAESLPDSDREILSTFDWAAEESRYRAYFESAYRDWEGIVPVPNFWEIGGHFPLYTEFGYTAFLSACALYPEAVGKIWRVRSLRSRERAKILCRLYCEYDLVPLMFCGEDLCTNQGPMVSPEFLRRWYLPTVAMIIEPLVDRGVRLVHHCDGDVRPLVDDFLDIGFSGFQGFQYEDGVDLRELRSKRSRLGEEPLLFAGMSVSRTLPFGSSTDIENEIDYFVEASNGGRGLFLHTSNVVGVEVPPENVIHSYHYAKSIDLSHAKPPRFPRWPNAHLVSQEPATIP